MYYISIYLCINYLRAPLDARTRCSTIAAYGRAGVKTPRLRMVKHLHIYIYIA